MTQPDTTTHAPRKKKSQLPILVGLTGAMAIGAGAFYATFSGLVLGGTDTQAVSASKANALPDITFIPIDPITISLGPQSRARHLRFVSQLEVAKPHTAEVRLLLPRISDVLNSYLRAVELVHLEDPSALMRLKAQMLRRIQIVTGPDLVRDLLISEFVFN